MSEAHVYLLVFRKAPELRAHFSMYFVYPETIAAGNGTPAHGTDCIGLLLHITGQKQTHYQPYACHKFTTTNTKTLRKAIRLGTIPADMVPRQRDVSTTKIGNAFLSTPIPKQSFNIRARIDDGELARCQEWTMWFIERLVKDAILPDDSIAKAQAERDPPDFGLGLEEAWQ